jgi:hypothetical protein
MGEKTLEPILIENYMVTEDICKLCKFYLKSEWYNHKWCVVCRYEGEDEQH